MSCLRALSPHIVTAKSFAQRAALVGALGLVGGAACSKAPADGDCEKLLLHLVEIEVNAGLANETQRAKHKLDLADGSRTNFVKRCNEELKADQVTCSLKAKTSEELEACDS
jgi:hypothetical protein